MGPVLFRAISGDHAGSPVPHLHAKIGDCEVVIELLPGKNVQISRAHPVAIRGKATVRELRVVVMIACESYDELLGLWRVSQP